MDHNSGNSIGTSSARRLFAIPARQLVDRLARHKEEISSILIEIDRQVRRDASIELIVKLEEADQRAEIALLEWIVAAEKREREEDHRRVEKSIQESQEHLGQIIQQWANVMSVAGFLTGVEQSALDLPEGDRAPVLERLELARGFLGTQAPLDFFLPWKTPGERFKSRYSNTDDVSASED